MTFASPPQLFEASWEVCNKVGGIYTVISSKIRSIQTDFPGRYLAIGPYIPQSASLYFKEADSLPVSLKGVAAALEKRGITLHYGLWQIEGEPPAVLLSYSGLEKDLNIYKGKFWEHFKLDTLGSDYFDVDQPLLWSIAVGHFVEVYSQVHPGQVILHAHEWLSGGAILYLKTLNNPAISTVFTTHATVLGRALSAQGVYIYKNPGALPAEQEATRLGVQVKHHLEALSAQHASVFTTVSELTNKEAELFLGVKAMVTPNGLDLSLFPSFDTLALKHNFVRELLKDFVGAYFFPAYRFDINQCSFQFTMGRYETHNKGYDLYLEALGKLNTTMKREDSPKTVVAFFLVPADSLRLKPETTEHMMVYRQINQQLNHLLSLQHRSLYQRLWDDPYKPSVMQLDGSQALRTQLHYLLSRVNPALTAPSPSPFELRHPESDPILSLSTQYGLHNRAEDRVKIVFFPIYFDGFDGIFNLSLYDIISGFDLGVFPSQYEPWGYTPMESLAMGVPAITSTLSGFGNAVKTSFKNPPKGVLLLDRELEHSGDTASVLASWLQMNHKENKRQWTARRISAYQSIQSFGWERLYSQYQIAYQQAVQSKG